MFIFAYFLLVFLVGLFNNFLTQLLGLGTYFFYSLVFLEIYLYRKMCEYYSYYKKNKSEINSDTCREILNKFVEEIECGMTISDIYDLWIDYQNSIEKCGVNIQNHIENWGGSFSFHPKKSLYTYNIDSNTYNWVSISANVYFNRNDKGDYIVDRVELNEHFIEENLSLHRLIYSERVEFLRENKGIFKMNLKNFMFYLKAYLTI